MASTLPTHLVCPSCKRPVVALGDAVRAECAEHGSVVPMRSVIVNAPLLPKPLIEAQYAALGWANGVANLANLANLA